MVKEEKMVEKAGELVKEKEVARITESMDESDKD